MITAICEMIDQHRCIEEVEIIENTPESMQEFYDRMEEHMGVYGFGVQFFDAVFDNIDDWTEREVYSWMEKNDHLEIEHDGY